MNNLAIVAMDSNNIPESNDPKTIFTLEGQPLRKTATTKIIEIPTYVSFGDDVVNLFLHSNANLPEKPEFQNMLQFVYFAHMTAFYLSQQNYDEVIFEDRDLREKILLQFDNRKRYSGKTSLLLDDSQN